MKRPSFQFYPGDWRSNSNLRRCTLAERGAWLEVICLLHDQDEYGIVRWTLKEIAQASSVKPVLIQNLVRKGVLKGDDKQLSEAFIFVPRSGRKDGEPVTLIPLQKGPIWYSSRMVRDEYVRTIRGESTRYGEAPKGTPDPSPKPPIGDGPSSSSSSSSSPSDIPIQSSQPVEKIQYQPDPHEGEFEQTLARWKGYGGTGLSMPEWTVFQKLLSNYPQGILIHGNVEPSALVASKSVVEAMTSGRNYGVANSASQYIKSIMERCVRDGVWPGEFAEKAPKKRIDPDANAAEAAKRW